MVKIVYFNNMYTSLKKISQLPFNEKTSTKRINPSGFYKPGSQKRKRQDVFSQILPQGQYVQQQYESNPQLYGLLPPISFELKEIQDETALQSFAKRKDNCEQNQDLDEKSEDWKINEIKILLDYLKENFSFWSKGNKTKFYNNIAKSILPNKEANAIKDKLSRLFKKYEEIKKYTNNQSGVDQKDWYCKNNVEVISMVIVEMSQLQEKIWEQKMKDEFIRKRRQLQKENKQKWNLN
ncbi:hypothetical protein C1646_774413 [Rhizophagus diaphanus]|nr:hypothetical protein C1646_774413 [Rhizophagus diaphanus] [Rhizophagus sp. MUCL 43196]